jgi:hypothetical protein
MHDAVEPSTSRRVAKHNATKCLAIEVTVAENVTTKRGYDVAKPGSTGLHDFT